MKPEDARKAAVEAMLQAEWSSHGPDVQPFEEASERTKAAYRRSIETTLDALLLQPPAVLQGLGLPVDALRESHAALLAALEQLYQEADGFSVSGVYFHEACFKHKGLDMAERAIAKAKELGR